MSIIRTLILREWFRFFIASCFVLFLLLSVANLISGFLRLNVTPMEVIYNHLLEIPTHLKMIFPIGSLVASLFSVNKLKNRNELTAIFASGYSRKKFFIDIILASTFVCLIQLFVSFFVEPYFKANKNHLITNSESKFRNLKSKGLSASTIGSGKIWFKSNNYFFNFSSFDKKKNILSNVSLYQFDPDQKMKTKIDGQYAKFDSSANVWILYNGIRHDLLNNNAFPIKLNQKNFILPLLETPQEFKQIDSDITTLNGIKLYLYIKKLAQSGINVSEYDVILYDKISSSIVCIIFAILSSISIFSPNRRGSSFGKHLIFIFVFTIVFWLVNSYLIELGVNSKLDPLLSTFLLPFIFIFFIVIIFLKNRRLR